MYSFPNDNETDLFCALLDRHAYVYKRTGRTVEILDNPNNQSALAW